MEWLTALTNWLRETIEKVFSEFIEFLTDFLYTIMEFCSQAFLYILNSIPVPEFLQQFSICELVGNSGQVIAWLWGELNLDLCMGVLAAGYTFRILRKLFTLGQW